MEKDVRKFVSECEACQLAKGTKPHRQGMSIGHRYTEPGTHLCLDLVGPVDTDTPGGSAANHIFVAFDPSTHFVYFIPIENKTAREVASSYMEHVILEQIPAGVIIPVVWPLYP